MIVKEVFEDEFIREMRDYDPSFSSVGLSHLYEYLDDLSEDINEAFKLDIVALSLDFKEFKDSKEYLENHNTKLDDLKDFANREIYLDKLEEEIRNNTTLIKFGDSLDEGFIIQAY